MVFKVVWLVKRKPEITHEQFRAAYMHHAQIIKKYLGSTILEYRINFPTETHAGINQASEGNYFSDIVDTIWDCATTMTCKDRAAFEEGIRIASQPEIAKIINADENGFIDHKSVITLYCDEAVVKADK